MLTENVQCLNDRIKNSVNPFLNEFNLVYKDINSRLGIFEEITAQQPDVIDQETSDPEDWMPMGQMQQAFAQYQSHFQAVHSQGYL